MAKAKHKIRFKYIGSGAEFLHGIPARDLTETDWDRLTKEQQEIVIASLVYQEVEAAKSDKAKEE